MFNLEYLAANVGADLETDGCRAFKNEQIKAENGKVTLTEAAKPLNNNATVTYAWARKASDNAKMAKYVVAADNSITSADFGNDDVCVMYYKAVAGDKIQIKSQFIPATLHAVLTVALYSGDACNTESATKAGEVVIDIPRFQLSGAQDIAMSATGAAQVALDGTALASGCTGCDGQAIYATITRVITGAHWYDEAQGIVIEDLSGIAAGATVDKDVVVYAYYANKAPKKLDLADLTFTFTAGTTGLTWDAANYKITGTAAAGTAVLRAVCTAKAALEANKAIVIA